jgi:hypothetical protein
MRWGVVYHRRFLRDGSLSTEGRLRVLDRVKIAMRRYQVGDLEGLLLIQRQRAM